MDGELKDALQKVVMFTIDAEKGEGIVLAKQNKVHAYPTFILLNNAGITIDYWLGYEKAYFLSIFNEAITDTSTLETKAARYQTAPTVKDALSLGRFSSANGDYKAAVDYYSKAQQIKTDTSQDYAFEVFENTINGADRNLYTLADMIKAADAVLASNDKTPEDVIETAQMMVGVDKQDGKIGMVQKYLEAALKVSDDKNSATFKRAHDGLLVDYNLYVKNDTAAAIIQKKANMSKGWENDASALNEFAWWCFENKMNLKKAEKLARHAVDIAEPGESKAMISDTAAEICFARGNKGDAIKFARLAVKESPDKKYYQMQLDKFEGKAPSK
jgi:tetratricopeptide (TPR) repeat protein